MKNLFYLFVTLLITLCWNQSIAQESFQQEFENKDNFAVEIKRGAEVLHTLQGNEIAMITVREGDRITSSISSSVELADKALYGVEPMYMAKMRNKKINIRNLLAYHAFDERSGRKQLSMDANYKGVNLATYDQMMVTKSFSSQAIFEGMGTHMHGYKFEDGEVLPLGFDYDGHDNDKFGSDRVSSYSSARKFEEGFSIGVTAAAPIPGTPVTVGVGVGYSKVKKEASAEDDVYFSNFSGIDVYTVSLHKEDLLDVLLSEKFRDAVKDLNNQGEVEDEIIKRFGTHYPESVTYGGSFRSWKHVASKDYYEMTEQGIDVKAEVSLATPVQKTTETTSQTNSQGNGFESATENSQGGAQGNAGFNFKHVQKDEYKNKLSNSSGNFRSVGGPGDHAAAVKTQLVEIHELVYPHIFKDGSTENDLSQKRDWIKKAVLAYLKRELPKMSAAAPAFKLYKAKLERAKKVGTNLDDANQKMKGSIVLKEPGTANEYPLWSANDFIMIHESSGELVIDVSQPWTIVKVPIINGVPKDITLNAAINLINLDDCCGNDPHIGSLSIRLKDILGVQEFTKKVTHTAFFEETHWEVKIVMMEVPDLDTPHLVSINRSTSTSQPISYVTRSSSITEKEFNAATKAVVINTKPPVEEPKKVVVNTAPSIAKGKPSKQSSVLNNAEGYKAKYANDGIPQTLGGGFIACTANEANPWWEVDLQGYFDIYSVTLHNRTNCCPDRLDNFTILVSVEPFTGNFGGTTFIANQAAPNGTETYFGTAGKANGRYVRIFLNQTNYLSIPEIEISGMFAIPGQITAPPPAPTPTPTPVPTPAPAAPAVSVITPVGGDFVRIQNSWYKNHYVHNQNGTIEQGVIQPNWWSAQWKVVPAYDGWVRIQNRWYPDQYLHNQNGKIEVGTMQPNWWSAQWKLVPAHSGWVRIQNRWYPDQYLHNQNGTLELGPIQPNWASALWKLE